MNYNGIYKPYRMSGLLQRFRMTLDMIKFEHSIFALPFALTGALLAFRDGGYRGDNLGWKLVWIVVAMVGARSAAMTFNRIADAAIDAKNPRTESRQLPSGQLSVAFAWGFLLAAAAIFFAASAMLNRLCLLLSPLALACVLLYSYTKRFTSLAHMALGFCLGIAPSAAWIAIRGSYDARMLWLTAAVTFWTAGFDIIYSCQDFEFDRREGLFSVPGKFGIARALLLSRALHAAMLICLGALVIVFALGWLAWAGVAAIAALLVYEHRMVSPADLSRVNAAFFAVNGYVSVLFFAFWATDILIFRSAS